MGRSLIAILRKRSVLNERASALLVIDAVLGGNGTDAECRRNGRGECRRSGKNSLVNERANGSQLTRIRSEGGISDAGRASGDLARLVHLRGIRPGSEKERHGGGTPERPSWGEEASGLLTLTGISSIGVMSSTKAFRLSSDV